MSYLDLLDRHPGGRPPKYDNADDLMQSFRDYVKYVEDNPLIEVDFRGKDAEQVNIPRKRPLTKQAFALWAGFCSWEDVKRQGMRGDKFSEILSRIEACIYNQKLEGAAAGFFNSSIIARDLGLVDKQNTEITTTEPLLIIRTEKGGA